MSSDLVVGLAASVFGGSLVSMITFFGSRERTRAETVKLLAEAEKTRAETTALLAPGGVTVDRHSGVPEGWIVAGSRPDDYDVRIDRSVAHSGSCSARVEALPHARGFGTLMQKVQSHPMRGERIRMSAFAKTEDVAHAGFWMRIDGPDGAMFGFDNMDDRPITGTSDWHEHSIVLDVPTDSTDVAFGVLLIGRGRIWVDDFAFEPVDRTVPVTDMLGSEVVYRLPTNLDFED